MRISIEGILQILGFVGTLMWMSYRFGKIESAVNARIQSVEHQLHLHVSRYDGDKNLQDHVIKVAYDRIDHTGNKLRESQKEIQKFLAEKQGFVIREKDLD